MHSTFPELVQGKIMFGSTTWITSKVILVSVRAQGMDNGLFSKSWVSNAEYLRTLT